VLESSAEQIRQLNLNLLRALALHHFGISTYGRCAFGHVGPSTWNALPNYLNSSTHSLSTLVGTIISCKYVRPDPL